MLAIILFVPSQSPRESTATHLLLNIENPEVHVMQSSVELPLQERHGFKQESHVLPLLNAPFRLIVEFLCHSCQ